MPEADLIPLTQIAQANAAAFGKVGVHFPEEDGVEVWLSPDQIRKLASMYPQRNGDLPRFENKWGYLYVVRVSRRKDNRAPAGYYYDWCFYSLGRDGILYTEDDIGVGAANSP